MVIYFGEELEKGLRTYIESSRKAVNPLPGHENALFLSTQRKRMGVQSVENMVKKYARQVTPNKKITPHKLRSTYGTALYKETGDIYLVADVLGHKDVNTTKKHYAAIDEDRRRSSGSRNVVLHKKFFPNYVKKNSTTPVSRNDAVFFHESPKINDYFLASSYIAAAVTCAARISCSTATLSFG